MNRKEEEWLFNDLKDAFLDGKAWLKVGGNNICLDDFVGVILPESELFINSCENIRQGGDLTFAFHAVLNKIIDDNLANLSYQDIDDLFD